MSKATSNNPEMRDRARAPWNAAASGAAESQAVGSWKIAWLLVLPLAIWLGVAKTILVMNGFHWAPKDNMGLLAIGGWLAWFAWLRVLFALAVGYGIQRLLFKRQRWTMLPFAVLVMVALAFIFTRVRPGQTVMSVLDRWTDAALSQFWGIAACLWEDAVAVAITALVFGIVLRAMPRSAHAATVTVLQGVVALLCALVGIDLVYEFGTGQPASTRVLLFALQNARDIAPIVKSEVTGLRVLGLVGGVALAVAWAWRQRGVVRRPGFNGSDSYVGGALALLGSLALLLPAPPPGSAEVFRFSEGTLTRLLKTAWPSPAQDVTVEVAKEFEQSGRPPWYSDRMTLKATSKTRRHNVVIVMMESIRAQSSTVNVPGLPTMPFLKHLADEGLMVEDMNAVAPRTAAAWMAVLGGQYPLANGDTAGWAAANEKVPRIRTLPSALRDAGYATSFFTPTDMEFQSDPEIIRSFNFEEVQTEPDLTTPGQERPTYFGIADESMVKPILAWTAAQVQEKRPFFTAVMTNVGHHDFQTPSTWKKIRFEGVEDPARQNYYNCLRYIDGVLSQLMEGYRRLGVLDDTIFLFVGDHGVMLDEHHAKQSFNSVYQESLRVPAVVYAPGLPLRGTRVKGARQQIDIVPTIAELLGYTIEGARLPGRSLLQPVAVDRELFFTSSIDWSALGSRRGPRKYIYTLDGSPMEAFDLDKDPGESTPLNVPDAESAQAQARMLKWRAQSELSMFARPDPSAGLDAPWLRN